MRLLKWLFMGEVLFAGFITSSVFKAAFPNMLDLTAIFLVLSGIAALNRLRKSPSIYKFQAIPIIVFVALIVLMLASLLWTPSVVYASDKLLKFTSITLWSFIGVFILIKNTDSLVTFLKGVILFSLFTVGLSLDNYFFGDDISYRVGIEGKNVLGLGRLAGVGAILIFSIYLYDKKPAKLKLLAFLVFLITVFTLLITGSRMPLLALVLSLVALFPLSFKYLSSVKDIKISKNVLSVGIVLVLSVPFFIYLGVNGFYDTMIARLKTLFVADGGGASSLARRQLFENAQEMFYESPLFGYGVGSFPVVSSGSDQRGYPHNIFLEMLSEFGIVGLFLLLSIIIYAIYAFYKAKKLNGYFNAFQISILISSIFFLINANSTGDINDNRILFTFLALLISTPLYNRNADEKKCITKI